MPELLTKSNQNFISASLLIDNGLYASSVHCSYYACFQKLKNVIAKVTKADYEGLEDERNRMNNSPTSKGKVTTHKFLIDVKLSNHIRNNYPEDKDVHKLINDLNVIKKYRVDSDYLNISVSPDKARTAYKMSESTIKTLSKLK